MQAVRASQSSMHASSAASSAPVSQSSSSSSMVAEDLRLTVTAPKRMADALNALRFKADQTVVITATADAVRISSHADDLSLYGSLVIVAESFSKYSLLSHTLSFAVALQPLADALTLYASQTCVLSYPYEDAYMRLAVEEAGVVSQCLIRTRVHDRVAEVEFLRFPRVVQAYMHAESLSNVLQDLDWCDGTLTWRFRAEAAPFVEWIASGATGNVSVKARSKDKLVSSIEVSAQDVQQTDGVFEVAYLLKHMQLISKALALGVSSRVRVNRAGVMSVQMMLELGAATEKKSFVELFAFAVDTQNVDDTHAEEQTSE
jgi:hypothetical protein